MCKHTYTTSVNRKEPIGSPCKYTLENLPHDTFGRCIFHSKDADWKRKNNFADWFELLLQHFEAIEGAAYDLREVIFVAERENSGVIAFSTNTFAPKRKIYLQKAIFMQPVLFNDFEMKGGLELKQAIFQQELTFKNCKIEGLNLTEAEFWEKVRFRELQSISYAYFDKAIFQNGLQIMDSAFWNMASFEEAQFRSRNTHTTHIDFKNTVFHYEANFNKSVFNAPVFFEHVDFQGSTTFEETIFYVSGYEAGPYQAVNFEKIKVGENARLLFSGLPSKKLFTQDVGFEIADLQGIINFENVDFFRIDKRSRDYLHLQQRENKVIIGTGCIKYRLSFSREVQEDKISLDIAQTFVNYFNLVEDGINLGVEIVENKAEKTKKLLYFSDADISQEEFESRLMKIDEEIWRNFYHSKLLNQLKADNQTEMIHSQENFIEHADIWLKLNFDRIRLGLMQKYAPEKYAQVIAATTLNPNVSVEVKNQIDGHITINFISNYSQIKGDGNIFIQGAENSTVDIQKADKIYNIDKIDNANFS
jgi:uncharacterized protein YjbI with pentapeptide repeats